MQVQHIETFHQKASVSRRDLIAGLAAGTIIAMAGDDVGAASVDSLDVLIERTDTLRDRLRKVEGAIALITKRADRPPFPTLRPAEIDARYSGYMHRDLIFRKHAQVREFFAAYRRCLFGSDRAKAEHETNERRALIELSRRIALNKRWEERTGLAALDEEAEWLCDRWLESEREIFLYPCSTFSMVARKVAYIRRAMDGDDFTSELGTAIILTMDGGASLAV
ncbi:hypothetical protein RsS62_23900 [Rhizobium dioscoreae]|uniref:hypothetical protein n=1 Tax=Rhizobium dioscoreae TaxID=2653122 RepID=UPI00126109D7|nr:hypothetical protein [Rhizobium dioscoreae]GES43138.1 hypothetical protein RsS62_23900 [Rhizobium dioscoreae]